MNSNHDMTKATGSLVTVAALLAMSILSTTFSNANAVTEGESNIVYTADLANIDDKKYLISAELALNAVQEADRAGADTTLLIHRYNEALDLLDNEQIPESTSCTTYEECKNVVDNMFVSITADAVDLKNETNRAQRELLIVSEISVVALAVLVSFLGLYTHRTWKNYQIKRFLAMEIKEPEGRI